MIALAMIAALQTVSPCLGITSHPAGYVWTYAGTRTVSESAAVTQPVTWSMRVIARRSARDLEVVLVRGFIGELAWTDRSTRSELSILACSRNALWYYAPNSTEDVYAAFDRWDDTLQTRATLLLRTPLADGAFTAQDSVRSDRLYGWEVQELTERDPAPRSCRGAHGPAYELTYRTLPDASGIVWQDGPGILAYRYQHHGTTRTIDVRLISCARRESK
jgi:hypothetical protein